MNIRIVNVCKNDAEFLHRNMNEKNMLDALDEIPTQLNDWIDAISAWNCDPDEEDYLIFDEKTPIGWLGINGLLSEDKVAYIKMIGLLPQYQSKGVGAYVINYSLKNLKSRGFAAVALYTNQSNYRAKNCYMKCGFKVSEELTEEMANGNLTKRYKMEIVF